MKKIEESGPQKFFHLLCEYLGSNLSSSQQSTGSNFPGKKCA